ncbi:MAG: hypothetical protein ACK5UW_09605, partial [bacterium]
LIVGIGAIGPFFLCVIVFLGFLFFDWVELGCFWGRGGGGMENRRGNRQWATGNREEANVAIEA